jgi:DHA1 family multidrug resistance protein-like MFS transporter
MDAEETVSPQWKRTLVLTALSQVLSLVGFSFVTPFIPLFIQQLGIHGAANITLWAALLTGGSSVFMIVAAPIWGALADRHGRKVMVVRAALSAGVLVVLMAAVQSVWQLLLLRLLQGMFTGTVSASQALVASQSPSRRMGMALGIMQTSVYVGTSIGPLLGGVVADSFGYRFSFVVGGISLFVSGLLVLLFVREHRVPSPAVQSPPFWRDLGSALRIPVIPAMIGTYFAIQFGATVVTPILPQFVQSLQGSAGHAATVTGVILAGAGVASAVAAIVVGFFSDRIGYKSVLVVASIAAAVVSVPQFFVTATWQLFVLRVLIGLAIGAIMPAAGALTANLVPASRRGTAYGLTGSANSLGFGAGPLTAALVVSVAGLRPVFLTAAVLMLVIAVWVAAMVQVPPGGVVHEGRPRSESASTARDTTRVG